MNAKEWLIRRLNDWGTVEAEPLAEYLLANGVIVPPCKVGDTVYAYCDTFCVVLPYIVSNFHSSYMGQDKENYLHWEGACFDDENDMLIDDIEFDLDDIGKTVFFTLEEAEKALAEREGAE